MSGFPTLLESSGDLVSTVISSVRGVYKYISKYSYFVNLTRVTKSHEPLSWESAGLGCGGGGDTERLCRLRA